METASIRLNDLGAPTSRQAAKDNVLRRASPRRSQFRVSCLRLSNRTITKVFILLCTLLLLITIVRFRNFSAPVSAAAIEAAKSKTWLWRNFPRHQGLVRGNQDFPTDCKWDQFCGNRAPAKTRYYGNKTFAEPLSDVVPCIGPRAVSLSQSIDDAIWAFEGTPNGAVDPVFGSYNASGLDGTVSFDRIGRYQAYGIDQFEEPDFKESMVPSKVDWDRVDWGSLQAECAGANHDRFKPVRQRRRDSYGSIRSVVSDPVVREETTEMPSRHVEITKRTAILLRVWTGANWTADAVINLRAMISEASLSSGGKYQVFILLHVKDEKLPVFVAEDEPRNVIRANIPPEFHSMAEVWNHAQTRSLYSNMAEHAFVGRSPWMIVQWFARNHPEFDFFYQWEFDVRFTGHYLDFFESVATFARNQPRKGIWERAGRVYIPSIHGEFDTKFRDSTHNEDPHHVWGPVSVEGVSPRGPKPPISEVDDHYVWGVGEDADWVGFLPEFNVTGTRWWYRDYIWGYPEGASTPRRATLITQGRVSRKLVEIMSYENSNKGHLVDAEMFPQTVCLHHGLKATTFPHPIYSDTTWPAASLQQVFNPGPFGQAGGAAESTFSKWNEYAWSNMTWYYNSALAKPTYQQFMGVAALAYGGPSWEMIYGRTVIRPMLLHSVKGAKATKWTKDGWTEVKDGK